MTIAEQISAAFGDDGQQQQADISLAISGSIFQARAVDMEDACRIVGVERHYRHSCADRFEFADGSAIVTTDGGAWDLGLVGFALDCTCWAGVTDEYPHQDGHCDECPEIPADSIK